MKRILVCAVVLFLSLSAVAQQQYVNRVGIFTGYSYLNTPSIGLGQNGFNTSAGINLTRWIEFGGDFSVLKGNTGLTLTQTKLGPSLSSSLISKGVPSSVVAALAGTALPIDATTYTYQIGTQFNIRKWERFTPFVRPVLGVMHEDVNVNVNNLMAAIPPQLLPILGPALSATLKSKIADTVPMYGVGGGIDINATRHFGLRFSVDYAHTAMFDNMLTSQNNVRFSVGPTFKFGELKQGRK